MHQTDGIFVFPINFFREALAIFFLYQRSISNLISSSSYRGAGNLILKPLFLQKSGVLGAAAGQWETPTTTHLGSNYEAEMQRCLSPSSSSFIIVNLIILYFLINITTAHRPCCHHHTLPITITILITIPTILMITVNILMLMTTTRYRDMMALGGEGWLHNYLPPAPPANGAAEVRS